MNTLKFQEMSQNIETVSYTQQELRDFIKQCWAERDKLCKLMDDYRVKKIRPLHVKDVGKWIFGINSAISEINKLKGIAVRKERELKFGGVN